MNSSERALSFLASISIEQVRPASSAPSVRTLCPPRHTMAEQDLTPEQLKQIAEANEEKESDINYKPPAQKSLQEIQELDKDDESLRKYKEALLGKVAVVAGDLENFRKNPFTLKEGVEYRIKINFKYLDVMLFHLYSLPVSCEVDKSDYMVGSYGPRPDEEYEFLTTLEEAPKGMLARGTYNIKSKFTDDDKYDHLSWEWSLAIKKEWKD
ncbi:hypothetical protein GOODEAATRI_016749 [Goodea atripinnis]|uniref:Rho GDP-dissociation inhibitor 1 n=1 Tax=Goodea atripinnis TaxID=208336 RepID=A0ABV0MKD3_9TELE